MNKNVIFILELLLVAILWDLAGKQFAHPALDPVISVVIAALFMRFYIKK